MYLSLFTRKTQKTRKARKICTHGGGVMGEIVRKSEGVASDKALG